MAPIPLPAMQCLQIQCYFICKYFGDINNMQYGGMFYLYIEYPNSVKNYWITLGCVYMEVSHLHIETCFEMILIQVLSQQIFFSKSFSANISPAEGVTTG